MEIKKVKILLCSLIPFFCIMGIKDTNASMQDKFKSQAQCSYEAATYADSKYRYCINKKTKRITSYEYSGDRGYVENGFLGSQEMKQDINMLNAQYYYNLYEWGIDGNKLIQYRCETEDGLSCAGEIQIYTEAKKK